SPIRDFPGRSIARDVVHPGGAEASRIRPDSPTRAGPPARRREAGGYERGGRHGSEIGYRFGPAPRSGHRPDLAQRDLGTRESRYGPEPDTPGFGSPAPG